MRRKCKLENRKTHFLFKSFMVRILLENKYGLIGKALNWPWCLHEFATDEFSQLIPDIFLVL